MKPILDTSKEYGLVLEGGGAKGAYQIGAWRALLEAGIKIRGIAGTSVGALNGALICMGDIENAENVWSNISYSKVMDVSDDKMQQLFRGEMSFSEAMEESFKMMNEGGIDVTPLRNLIADCIDEEKIVHSPTELYILTFNADELKEIEVNAKEIPPESIKDFLLASAYIFPLFKNEKLMGTTYIDGGAINNVPLGSLVERDYEDIIMIRIFGPGRHKKVRIPEGTNIYSIEPRVSLGNIIEFEPAKSRKNMRIGYYDAMRMIYGLEGKIYYIEETHEECYYLYQLVQLDTEGNIRKFLEHTLGTFAYELKLSVTGWTYTELYRAMLEATAKLCRIPKYRIYTTEELREAIWNRKPEPEVVESFPRFAQLMMNQQEENQDEFKRT